MNFPNHQTTAAKPVAQIANLLYRRLPTCKGANTGPAQALTPMPRKAAAHGVPASAGQGRLPSILSSRFQGATRCRLKPGLHALHTPPPRVELPPSSFPDEVLRLAPAKKHSRLQIC